MGVATHLTHWGAFEADGDDDAAEELSGVRPWRGDPDPRPLIDNVASAHRHPTRVDRPSIRRDWLENGPGPAARGTEEFVAVSWEQALDLLSAELRRVYADRGPHAVFGGSYGWSSAGRFHHAQSQLHRFLNVLGGYTRSVHSYSYGAAEVLLPHVIGPLGMFVDGATSGRVIAQHTELFVAFGGLSPKNSAVNSGGVGRRELTGWSAAARRRGCRFVSIGPLRDDTAAELEAEWIAPRPGTDAALLLALAHVLDQEDLTDRTFLDRYTVGFDRFAAYLRGETDDLPKTPEWAESVTTVPAARIRDLAHEMAGARTLINISWSLQRTHYGEQPLWLGVVVSAMLGQIGLPGGGFAHGYGSMAGVGKPPRVSSVPALPQGTNGVESSIPVARIADLLLHPGEEYDFDGARRTYPDIRLVYWAGGNPFHHHQDLARLREAFARPDTVVVHDAFWSSTARHADIVLPATMSVERDDIGAGRGDPTLVPMRALVRPHAQARDDYAIFADLADRLGVGEVFTEGRRVDGWLRHLYGDWRDRLAGEGHELPGFDDFWKGDPVEIPVADPDHVLLNDFRADPDGRPLSTPSGRIEIFSETIDRFGYADCPGHPVWLEPEEWLGADSTARYPLHLIANQPHARLHSQLDVGAHSRSTKVSDREPLRLHPEDAAARGLRDGDVALVRNDRGRCLAGVELSADVRRGVVQLSTGAWYDPDPDDPSFCRHGNPNVLTADRPTSRLAQGCTGQHALVEVSPYAGGAPPLTVLQPPPISA